MSSLPPLSNLPEPEVSKDLTTADDRWPYHVLETITAGVVVFDPSGRVLYGNRRAASLLDLEPGHLVGHQIDELMPSVREWFKAPQYPSQRLEFQVRLHDGQTRVLGGTISQGASAHSGLLPYMTCLFQDITQVRLLQEERNRLLQISALNAVLPSVLHELRNPIAAIEAMVELLVEDAPEHLRSDLRAILVEVHRMSLNLRGVGSVGSELRSESLAAIDEAIEDVARIMSAKAREHGIELAHPPFHLPPLCFDPVVVGAIVFNLVDNALKACGKGGHIRIDAKMTSRNELELIVGDDGCGMPPEVQARCTELFFTTRIRGSGIGLALCYRAVDEAGGTLLIDSAAGRGTTVVIRIPATARS